jgi:hypothetical protein
VRLSTAITREEVPPLELVEATPDSVWFARPKSVVETFLRHGTPAAQRLGEAFTSQPDLFALEMRGCEEGGGVMASARCLQLPVEVAGNVDVLAVVIVAA